MITSRRSVIAAGVGVASLGIAETFGATSPSPASSTLVNEVDSLIALSVESNAALLRGDIDRYLDLIGFSADFTLMSPFGGKPTHAQALSEEKLRAMGRFFRNGTLQQEVVQSYASSDLVVLAIVERARVEVGGLPDQEWALRVTLVYRREASGWRLAHRHADPLHHPIDLKHAAALARGDAMENA
ncbi:MAG: DUF4440 domain-containing protein [Pseudoxanthomonas sp.]